MFRPFNCGIQRLVCAILLILGQTGFGPRRLEIEITESALVENILVAQTVVDQLREVGVRIAPDDFGKGYATLSQLLSFHLDKIKIDRSFVSRLNKSNDIESSPARSSALQRDLV